MTFRRGWTVKILGGAASDGDDGNSFPEIWRNLDEREDLYDKRTGCRARGSLAI
jgi:hypothetical protein